MTLQVERYIGQNIAVVAPGTRTAYAMEVGASLNSQIKHETRIGWLEEDLETVGGSDLDNITRQLVLELVAAGRIDKFRLKMFGVDGNGGFWGNPKIVSRRKLNPETYGQILITAMDDMGQMSQKGGKMPLGFFDELCGEAEEMTRDLKMQPEKKDEIFQAVMRMTQIGVEKSEKLRARLARGGVASSDLYNKEGQELVKLVQIVFGLYK